MRHNTSLKLSEENIVVVVVVTEFKVRDRKLIMLGDITTKVVVTRLSILV